MCAVVTNIPGVHEVTGCYVSRTPTSLLLAAKLVAVENPSVDPMVVLGETARIRWGFEAWQPDGLSIQGSQGSERLTAARLVDSANGTLDHYDLTEMFGPWTGELSTTAPTIAPTPTPTPTAEP